MGQLKHATQEMPDAVARGDKAVWERNPAEGNIYADEEVREITKHELTKKYARCRRHIRAQ